MAQPRDPWEPFRFWLAFTLALYALRAVFVAQGPGAIPGWVLLALLLLALALAAKALVFPGRVQPFRQGDGGWWNDLRDDWQLWWKRRRGEE
ncbi:MAG: hypothetical protein KFB97_10930 [Cyanobium sp. M30B3]|nr:MAG: hypothetical protein KFB97_10930 [Cyanobium sp. M30B3]